MPSHVWLECGEAVSGFWQDIIYKKVPSYYKNCKRLGHAISVCKLSHPELAKVPDKKGKKIVETTKVFKKKDPKAPKDQNETPEAKDLEAMEAKESIQADKAFCHAPLLRIPKKGT